MTYQEVENVRKAYLKRLAIQCLVVVAIIISIVSILVQNDAIYEGWVITFSLPFFIIILFSIFNNKVRRSYRKAYKGYFVEQNLRKIFTDLEYSHEQGIPSLVLYSTGVINTGDRYSSNDFTKGKYKGVDFAQSDVHIEVKNTDSDGNTTYTTIFKGRFMVFEFPKKFNYKLALVGKRFPAFKKPSANKTTGRKMETISTESTEFNRILRTYAEDGFEAFYILDPALIAKIEDITTHYKRKIIFCFINNSLIIGINDGKDSLEPPRPFRHINEAKENAKVSSDIKIITDFVDQLSLSDKLFK